MGPGQGQQPCLWVPGGDSTAGFLKQPATPPLSSWDSGENQRPPKLGGDVRGSPPTEGAGGG